MSIARYVLTDPSSAPSTTLETRTVAARFRRVAIVAASFVAGLAVSGVAVWRGVSVPIASPPEVMRFAIVPNAQPVAISNLDRQMAISPDGKYLAYVRGVGPRQLLIRSIDQLEPVVVPDSTQSRVPFFSPDSQWVGYYSNGTQELRKVSVTGGQSFVLWHTANVVPRGAAWAPDGSIVFGTNQSGLQSDVGLLRLRASGGEPVVLTRLDRARGEVTHAFPTVLPGGDILFTIWSGATESSQIAVLESETGQQKMLIRGGTHAEYVAPGYLIYASGSALHAVRFDTSRLEIVGTPVPVVERVFIAGGSGAAAFAVSRNGTLAYVPSTSVSDETRSLLWVDRQGREEPIAAPPHRYSLPRLSPDGDRVAIDTRDASNNDIWIWHLARRVLTRLTSDLAVDWRPVWTPDGQRVAFVSGRTAPFSFFWQASDALGDAERLMGSSSNGAPFPLSFTPNGKTLIFSDPVATGGSDLKTLTLASPPIIAPLFQTPFNEVNGELALDGRWLAYESNESGRNEIYVRPFPDVNAGKWPISSNGGVQPVWSRDGKELFFIDATPALMVAAVRTTPTFSPSTPTKLFDVGSYFLSEGQGRPYDVSPDGRRFLMIKETADPAGRPTVVAVLNWFEELKRLLPAQ